jgi:allantoin racemase
VPRIAVIQAIVPARGGLSRERETYLRSACLTDAEITICLPRSSPRTLSSSYEDAVAAPEVIRLAREAEADGAHAVVINCTADTAVEAVREALSIPVVAVSEASFHLAAQLAHRFTVLTFADRIAPRFRSMAKRWGMSDQLASVRSVQIPLEALPGPSQLAEQLAAAAIAAIQHDGAQLLVLGCTDFETAGFELGSLLQASGMPVPVLKPYMIGMHLAESLVAMRLAQSKLSFPTPMQVSLDS